MKKTFIYFALASLIFLSKTVFGQEVLDTAITHFIRQPPGYEMFLIKGRVIGLNLQVLQSVAITNIRTAEKADTDNNGIYQLNAAKGDTIVFEFSKLSKETRIIKNPRARLNVILIKRTAAELPQGSSPHDHNKAAKADDELYRILEKDAKLEGKWIY